MCLYCRQLHDAFPAFVPTLISLAHKHDLKGLKQILRWGFVVICSVRRDASLLKHKWHKWPSLPGYWSNVVC